MLAWRASVGEQHLGGRILNIFPEKPYDMQLGYDRSTNLVRVPVLFLHKLANSAKSIGDAMWKHMDQLAASTDASCRSVAHECALNSELPRRNHQMTARESRSLGSSKMTCRSSRQTAVRGCMGYFPKVSPIPRALMSLPVAEALSRTSASVRFRSFEGFHV